VNWILDADIAKFFDTIEHAWLIKFIEHRVADARVILDAHQFGPRFAHRNLTLRVRSCLSLRGGRSVVGLRECQ
jgi:hypothetical protein